MPTTSSSRTAKGVLERINPIAVIHLLEHRPGLSLSRQRDSSGGPPRALTMSVPGGHPGEKRERATHSSHQLRLFAAASTTDQPAHLDEPLGRVDGMIQCRGGPNAGVAEGSSTGTVWQRRDGCLASVILSSGPQVQLRKTTLPADFCSNETI